MSKIDPNKGKITLFEMRTQYLRILKEVGDLENVEAYPYENNSFTTNENWKVKVEFDKTYLTKLIKLYTDDK